VDEYSEAVTGTGELGERFENAAGVIQNLDVSGHVSIITSHAGSKRSSHWHREDWHYLYVVSGFMNYYSRPVGSKEPPEARGVGPGEMVYTGPNEEHFTEFPEDTVMVSVSKLHRKKAAHEADLTRVPWFE
jgi:quercetin dioxygenase-like cupin family protein